ncbi:MAG: type II toxin-antitoxin system HicB family antitoxin [Candidatus Altiarchaeota archaeon]
MELKIIIRKDLEDGGYNVSCPAIAGCHSQGDTLVEAKENIRDAIKGCLAALNDRAKSGKDVRVATVSV